ncbi:MAG: pyroglutamyl-peptidase I [Pirellulales bacterium]|nr:pyroglutamyl-peptidase I [Pirellulales bacterium]
MKRVLLTAFAPYGAWDSNASWLCVQELTRELPDAPHLTTRLYPVDFSETRRRLERDLAGGFDYAVHLGQAPGSARLRLEAVALNLASDGGETISGSIPLEPQGPLALQTSLPIAAWTNGLNVQGLPAEVSFHAGTYLCNAIYYWSLLLTEQQSPQTRSLFVHLPLELSQVAASGAKDPALPAAVSARAIRWILAQIELL